MIRRQPIVTLAILMLTSSALAQDPPALPGAQAPNLCRDGDDLLLTWLEPVPASEQIESGERIGDGDRPRRAERPQRPERPQRAERPQRRNQQRVWRMRFVRFAGGAWSDPVTIVQRDDLFVNWADVPSVVPGGDGALYAHWLQKSGPDTYAYDVMLARSNDGGATWKELGKAHDDHTQTEHGFVSFVPVEGGVQCFWLDGREMSGGHDAGGHGSGGNMTLRTAVVGAAPGEAHVLDARVCECCNTSAAMTSSGPIIAYRDRGPDERRDISIVRWLGEGWSVPKDVARDGWILPGCPVNGPAIDAWGERVVVAWFTGTGVGGAVLAAFSEDGGATFDDPLTLDDSFPIGRTDVILLEDGAAVAIWLDVNDAGGAIKAVRISSDGSMGEVTRLAESETTRTAGFPRIELLDEEHMLLVWTEDNQGTRLRAAAVQVPSPAGAGEG